VNTTYQHIRRYGAIGVALLVLCLAACGDDSNMSLSPSTPQDELAVATTAAPATTVVGATSGENTAPRQLIVKATISVETDDVETAVKKANDVAVAAGGLVTNADVRLEAPAVGQITLRVPPDKVESVMDQLGGFGRVTSRGKSTQDATGQVVDLEARIASARKSVDRAREFLDKATKVSDLAALEAELASRELVLEQLQSQQRELNDLTSLAAIDVTFTAPETPGVVPPAEEPHERPSPLDALKGGLSALLDVLLGIVVVLAAIAPFLAVALVLWFVLRRPVKAGVRHGLARARRRDDMPPPPPPMPAPSEEQVR